MKRILILLFAATLFVAPAFAQEATDAPTAEPTVVVTEVPAPPVVNIPNADTYISISTILYTLVAAVLGGGTVGVIILRFGNSKAVQDNTEKLYQSWPPATKELISRLLDVLEDGVKFGRVVTDGKPNDDDTLLLGGKTPTKYN